ncbi:hypothetical protein D3C72_1285110 [compost metagenome]
MRFIEREACKAFHLFPYRQAGRLIISFCSTVFKKPLLYFDHLIPVPVFPRHHPAQHIRISHVQPAVGICDLHYIFLVHHYPVRFFQLFFKYRMRILHRSGIMVPLNVFSHHTRRSHTRPYDRRGCNQRQVIITLQFRQQLSHSRTLYIKTTNRIGTF